MAPRLFLSALLALASCSLDTAVVAPDSDASRGADAAMDTAAPADSTTVDSTIVADTSPMDSGAPDTRSDTNPSDTSTPDTNPPDTGPPDAGPPASCGNRSLDSGEACDDGNNASGDGCSAWCEMEASYDDCPGAPLGLGLGTQWYIGDITGAARTRSCPGGAGSGPDAVYSVTPSFTGRLNLRVTAPFDAVLMVKSACPGTRSIACRDRYHAGSAEETTVAVTAGTTYMVVVSGYYGSDSGRFELRLRGLSP